MRRSNFPPSEGGINDWGLTYNTDYAVSDKRKKKKATFSVRVCPTCNIAFEITKDVYQGKVDIHYYEDFYKKGLCEQVCPKCK